MQLIEPSVEIINESDPFKKIELAGRTCYKSEANITEDSSIKFFRRLYDNQHFAMLEHATFIFKTTNYNTFAEATQEPFLNATAHYYTHDCNEEVSEDSITLDAYFIISGNLRAILESKIQPIKNALAVKYDQFSDLYDDYRPTDKIINLTDIDSISKEEISKHRYTTMRFITDRGVTHELVRHRLFSFAQESTRYVNYNKRGMQFIKPAEFDNWSHSKQSTFIKAIEYSEAFYTEMIEFGSTPQEARSVLPNAIKTEIVVTGNDAEWQHFFDLRSKGITGKPHPDMKKVADIAQEKYNKLYQNN